jgi:hypothetical protein
MTTSLLLKRAHSLISLPGTRSRCNLKRVVYGPLAVIGHQDMAARPTFATRGGFFEDADVDMALAERGLLSDQHRMGRAVRIMAALAAPPLAPVDMPIMKVEITVAEGGGRRCPGLGERCYLVAVQAHVFPR